MKKNETLGIIVYVLMLGIALAIGLAYIRPVFTSNAAYSNYLALPPVVFVILAMVASLIFNSVLIEVGHVIAAKIGKYEIHGISMLGLRWRKNKEGKVAFSLGSFDGLTGETITTPKDINSSNPRHFIYGPMMMLLVEAIGMVVLIIVSKQFVARNMLEWKWAEVWAVIQLGIAGMIYLYQIFPAALDSKNDGMLLPILTNKTNAIAYNQIMLSEYNLANGIEAGESPVYDEVTDFTSRINDISLYKALNEGDYEKAISIIDKTLACKNTVSRGVYNKAMTQKISAMFLCRGFEESKAFYIDADLEVKRYISDINNAASARTYLLVSGLVEESSIESCNALDKAPALIKKGSEIKDIEQKLLDKSVELVLQKHPDWDFSEYGYPKNQENGGDENLPVND